MARRRPLKLEVALGPEVLAGVSLALACDYRVASEDASFSMAFVRIGLIPDAGSSYLLPRTVGAARALELAVLSEKVTAERALEIGLVNRVVPAEKLMDEARELCRGLAGRPTAAIGLTKHAVYQGWPLSPDDAYWQQGSALSQAYGLEDFAEGFRRLEEGGYLTRTARGVELTRTGLLQVDRLLPVFFEPRHQTTRYT